jgi:hypothetical protein
VSRKGANEKEHKLGGWVSTQAWNEPPKTLYEGARHQARYLVGKTNVKPKAP